MKIRVCVPFYQEFEACKPGLNQLANLDHDIEFEICPMQGTYIGEARNVLTRDLASDYYLYVDSDIGFDPSQVLQLIHHNKDIVSGAYRTHHDRARFQAGYFEIGSPGVVAEWMADTNRGLQPVDFVGAGFLLVSKKVFQTLEYPWFRHVLVQNGAYKEETSEDFGFCLQAIEAGFKIWCDFDCEVSHRKRTAASFNWDLSSPGSGSQPNRIPANLDSHVVAMNKITTQMTESYAAVLKEVIRLREELKKLQQ